MYRLIKIIGIVFIIFLVLLSISISALYKNMRGAYGIVDLHDFIDIFFGIITASANLIRTYPSMHIREYYPVSADK